MKIKHESALVIFNNLVGTFGPEQVEEWIERSIVALEKIARNTSPPGDE